MPIYRQLPISRLLGGQRHLFQHDRDETLVRPNWWVQFGYFPYRASSKPDVVHLRAIINDNSGRFRKDLPHAMNYTEDGAFHGLGSICLPAAGASAPDHPQHPLDVSFRRDSSSLPVNDPPAFIGSASRRSTASRFTSRTTKLKWRWHLVLVKKGFSPCR